MQQELTLNVTLRSVTKKSDLKGARQREGLIPAVIYGKGEKNAIGFIDAKTFARTIHNVSLGNTLFNLKISSPEGKAKEDVKKAIIKDVQIDVVTRKPLHVDFQIISMASKIEVSVPVRLKGEAPGVKLHGGILEHFLREIKVKCMPKDIPPYIEVDVSSLDIGKGVTVSELPRISGVEYHADPHAMVVNVVAPKKEEAAAPAAGPAAEGAAPQEPEVISKGKKEEEGAAKEGEGKGASSSDAKGSAGAEKK